MAKTHSNILLVEGDEEKRVIPYLMDHHVVWGDKEDEWVAQVQSHGGIEELLQPDNLESAARVPGRKAVGIVIDANDHFDSRWARVRHWCLGLATDFRRHCHRKGSSTRTRRVYESVSGSCRTTNRAVCWRRS